MRITRRNAALLAWTALATMLYFGFGLALGTSTGRTLALLGLASQADRLLVADAVTAAFGPLLLGLSWVYRRLSHRENAGSVAAWLAGWALILLGAAELVGRFRPDLVPVVFVVLLVLSLGRLGLTLLRSREDPRS